MPLRSSQSVEFVTHFVIESPAYRCRAVEGPKKINKWLSGFSDPT